VLASRPSSAGAFAGPSAAAPETAAEPSAGPGEDDSVTRAMAAYERGTKNYNRAQYEEALADFTEAASLYASPDFQYNIGLCYEKLGKYDEAIRAFSTYLRAKPDADDRPNVENRIQMLQQELERREREAEDAEAARVAEPSPQPPPEPAQPIDDDAPPPATDAGRPLIVSGAALAGVGAAVALGGGIAFGVLAGRRSAAVDEVQTGGNPEELSFDETRELEREGKRFEGIQIGMVAGGAVVAVTGAVLLALGLRKRQAAGAQARLAPALGRGTAGLVLTGRF
jgi:tetratricopeptide (TPR) repeat protein